MTDLEAVDAVQDSLKLAQTLFDLIRQISSPSVAFPALALVAGTVAANLDLEDGADADDMFADWLQATKAQCEEVKKSIKKEAN